MSVTRSPSSKRASAVRLEPRQAISTVPTVRPPRATAQTLLTGRRSLVIVEDNPWLGSVMADALVGEDYKVLQTTSTRVAERLARAYHPDAILLDLELPDGAGPLLLATLKAGPDTGRIPVLVLTSQAERTSAQVRQAAHAILNKPFGLPELLAQLNDAIAVPTPSGTAA
ncbi:MAG TPA: response regulator [Chloroflexota bacterium]|jgi:DNA-binding response OmpR family regulator|nr:response regulator [Chloroflexota bacterium]